MHMFIASVRGWDNHSAASFTSLGRAESIPAAILVFTLWRRLLIYFVVTIFKKKFFSFFNNLKLLGIWLILGWFYKIQRYYIFLLCHSDLFVQTKLVSSQSSVQQHLHLLLELSTSFGSSVIILLSNFKEASTIYKPERNARKWGPE